MNSAAPPSPDWLAAQLAAFFSHAVRHGYSLNPETLARRSARHFDGASGIVRLVAMNLCGEAGGGWQTWPEAALAQFILQTSAFEPLRDDYARLTGEAPGPVAAPDAASDAEALAAWLDPCEAGAAPPEDAYPPFVATRPLPHAASSHALALPALARVDDIARLLTVSREEWNAALSASRYRLRALQKSSGGLRLIEIPPEPLRVLQRRLLHRLLDQVPAHEAAHGFVRGRSVHTHAAAHVGRAIVIRLDLKDFFPSISGARVFLLFRSLGYHVAIANALTAMCVTQQTRHTLREGVGAKHQRSADRQAGVSPQTNACWPLIAALLPRYGVTHLPQGAPTSPALANLCARSLDVRLAAWAQCFGATYTRYADDLVFSGDAALATAWRAFVATARVIIGEEGWSLNLSKTRVMRHSARQTFTGRVVNSRVNVPRCEYDALKASVHRYGKLGAAADAHALGALLGRIAWLGQSHPARAEKLRHKLLRASHTGASTQGAAP